VCPCLLACVFSALGLARRRRVVVVILSAAMYLMYYVNENGDKVYTLKKETPEETPTVSAHPARFSPDDKFSKHRIICKKRFGMLPTQAPPHTY